jgi:hypothetical protein
LKSPNSKWTATPRALTTLPSQSEVTGTTGGNSAIPNFVFMVGAGVVLLTGSSGFILELTLKSQPYCGKDGIPVFMHVSCLDK